MRRSTPVVGLTVAILLAGGYLAFYLHEQVKHRVLSQFSESQFQIARQAAGQIESYLRGRSNDLRHAAMLVSLQPSALQQMSPNLRARLAALKTAQVEEVCVADEAGTIVYSTAEDDDGLDDASSKVFAWAREPANAKLIRVAIEQSGRRPGPRPAGAPANAFRLVLATPLYRQSTIAAGASSPALVFAGVLLLRVDLEKLAERTLSPAAAGKDPHRSSIWVMDDSGTLLLQSEHPEMVSRNIRTVSDHCTQCHSSFDYAERMLTARQGVVDYELKGHTGKVAAFAPLAFENASWIVVVNAPKDDVTGFIQTNFFETIGLFGIIVLVVGAAFHLVDRNSQQRAIIAQESRHLQEKERLVDELREATEYLENLFDSASAPIIVWDVERRITRFNRACERLTGYTADELIGRELSTLFPPETREDSLLQILPTAGSEHGESPEVPILRKDGGIRIVLWNSAHIRAGQHGSVVATIAQGQDITERKRAEENLRAADEQLREQAALVRLGEMAAVVAHEVKNPLAGVRGAIQVIGSRLPPGNRDAAIIGDVIARLDALDELMKDLLLFARPPQFHPAPVDIVALAQETTALVSQDPAAQDVEFEVEGCAPPVIADPKLLKIVFLNVMLNAAHALHHAGAIRISVAANDHACRIAIADTGPGIPASIRDRIFVPFFTTKSRGTGLGLPTAKRLIDAHHGRITVECPTDGGTVVTVELPRSHHV